MIKNPANHLLAAVMTLILLGSSMPAQAQVASGISLGIGLLRVAAAARRRQQQQNTVYQGSGVSYGNQGSVMYGGQAMSQQTPNQETDNNPDPNYYSNRRSSGPSIYGDKKDSAKAISYYNKGVDALNAEHYQSAIKYMQQALQLNPNMDIAHAALGSAYEQAGDYEHALAELELESKDSANKDLCFAAGTCALKLQNYERSNYWFNRFLKQKRSGEQAQFAKTVTEILDKDYFHPENGNYFEDATKGQLRRWADASKPLKVYIAENRSLKGYKPEFAQLLRDSFAEWSAGSGRKVQFEFTNDPDQAQITCSWTDDRSKFESGNELGVTKTTVHEDGIISAASICLYTFADIDSRTSRNLLSKAKNVDLHEIGHSLGLEHSEHVYDIMYPTVFPEGLAFPLSARDTNTLAKVYSTATETKISDNAQMTSTEAVNSAAE